MKLFFTLLKVEWTKTMRMRTTYIGFVAIAVLVMIVQLGIFFGAEKTDLFAMIERSGLDTGLLVNGFTATRIAMEVGFSLLVAPMVILTFARQIAGEDLRGTLRLMLTRPIGRGSLMAAKFTVCSACSLLMMGFFLALSFGVGLALFGPHDSVTMGRESDFENVDEGTRAQPDFEGRNLTDGERRRAEREARRETWRQRQEARNEFLTRSVVTEREQFFRLFYAWGLTTWALMTVGAIAFFFSTINKHPIAAMALTVGTLFMVMIVQQLAAAENILPIFQRIRPYLFTSAMDFWRGCFSYEIDWREIAREGALLGAYTLFFYTAASLVLWRKDVTS